MCRRDTGRTNNFLVIIRLKDSGSYPASPCNPRFGLAVWAKIFSDVTPADLAEKGRPFPLGPFFADIKEAYEQKVTN